MHHRFVLHFLICPPCMTDSNRTRIAMWSMMTAKWLFPANQCYRKITRTWYLAEESNCQRDTSLFRMPRRYFHVSFGGEIWTLSIWTKNSRCTLTMTFCWSALLKAIRFILCCILCFISASTINGKRGRIWFNLWWRGITNIAICRMDNIRIWNMKWNRSVEDYGNRWRRRDGSMSQWIYSKNCQGSAQCWSRIGMASRNGVWRSVYNRTCSSTVMEGTYRVRRYKFHGSRIRRFMLYFVLHLHVAFCVV